MPNYPLPGRGEPDHGKIAVKDAGIDWQALREVRDRWPRRLVVKGVLDPRDAVACADAGVDGIIVSNHGGLLLDEAISPIEALSSIASSVADRVEIFLDGGVRRGSDVLKAVALGARAVFLGRPALFALAAFGEAGVTRAYELLREEVDRCLASLGCPTLADFSSDWLVASGVAVEQDSRIANELPERL